METLNPTSKYVRVRLLLANSHQNSAFDPPQKTKKCRVTVAMEGTDQELVICQEDGSFLCLSHHL
jgi:hypothetical protein